MVIWKRVGRLALGDSGIRGNQWVLPPRASEGADHLIKPQADAVVRLLKTTRQAESTRGHRALAAKLISVLYGLPLEGVLELDRSCVDTSGGSLRIKLGGDWVKVDEPVARLLREAVPASGR